MAEDQELKVVTGAHKRVLPPAGSHEHPVGTVIEAPDGKRYQVGYGGEKYVWHEVVRDTEADRQTADQRSVRRAQLEAELAALAPEPEPARDVDVESTPAETPAERVARLRAELAAAELSTS